jgi:hypothetical protein
MPFLTTRELFILKLDNWPNLAAHYLGLGTQQRQEFLANTVDHDSIDNSAAWTQPRDIGTIEWFASPSDICRVFASLASSAQQAKLSPVAKIMELNSGDMTLGSRWRSVWFKGGSEPGVLTLNYLATTTSGQRYVVSVLAENQSAMIASAATTTLITAIKGAFELAAK